MVCNSFVIFLPPRWRELPWSSVSRWSWSLPLVNKLRTVTHTHI